MSRRSKRRIVVLRDFSYTERQGEEELAIERFLCAAPEQTSISVQPPDFSPVEQIIQGADVLLSFGIKRYPDQVFEWLLAHPRHIHVAQDWWEPTQPQSKWRDEIVQQAATVIFMSPLHQDRYTRIYRLSPRSSHVIAFPMPRSDWAGPYQSEFEIQDAVLLVQDAVLWCAPWHPDYGNDIMLRWADRAEERIHAYGLAVPTEQIAPLVEGRGSVALDVAAPTFRAYSRFAFFPRTPVPFGFTFMLAFMLGLEVTYSGEIGCLSYMPQHGVANLDGLADFCDSAPEAFWRVVEEVAA